MVAAIKAPPDLIRRSLPSGMTTGEPGDRDTLRVQMQQAIETFRHLTTLFTQCAGFDSG
jgi:hypothetical protein